MKSLICKDKKYTYSEYLHVKRHVRNEKSWTYDGEYCELKWTYKDYKTSKGYQVEHLVSSMKMILVMMAWDVAYDNYMIR